MIQPNELILLLLGLITLAYSLANRRALSRWPGLWLLQLSFWLQLVAWVFTNLEGLTLALTFNLLEHLCEGASVLALLAWMVRVTRSREASP